MCDGDERRLGVLWVAVQKRAGKRVAYVYDIYVDPAHRRQGHATGALQALDSKAGDLGFSGVALHVFGHNAGAQALYEKLGFVVTDSTMFRSLESALGE
jgi:ribosomal protein S18 acetylase RimI-like enzyme